jgi:hypothetical protein
MHCEWEHGGKDETGTTPWVRDIVVNTHLSIHDVLGMESIGRMAI